MIKLWQKNIANNWNLIEKNIGPRTVTVVCGSETDAVSWKKRLESTCSDIFRKDGNILVVPVVEHIKKGSFLGTLKAWKDTRQVLDESQSKDENDIFLMSLVIGKGTRLSPFTQAVGNRKPAFWTPIKAKYSGTYLNTADISNFSVNIWIDHLRKCGFSGLIVKWGDELIIPGINWETRDYSKIDAFRCVGHIEITEVLASEKDWVVVNSETGLMQHEFTRQDINSLKKRLLKLGDGANELRINLGSVVLSPDFLDVGLDVFYEDILDETKWVDWDPYAWVALFCKDEKEWMEEKENEKRQGYSGIVKLEARYPDFFRKMATFREKLENKTKHRFSVGTLDFGDSFWIDLGLQVRLRENMELMNSDSEGGQTIRELFDIPHKRDRNGNIFVRSVVPESADIKDSLIVDSVILDPKTKITRGQIVGGRHRKLTMPYGGTALFCATNHMDFREPNAIAFHTCGEEVNLLEGERLATMLFPEGMENMVSHEKILDYNGDNYSKPIMENRLSFEEAGEIMGKIQGDVLEQNWRRILDNWL